MPEENNFVPKSPSSSFECHLLPHFIHYSLWDLRKEETPKPQNICDSSPKLMTCENHHVTKTYRFAHNHRKISYASLGSKSYALLSNIKLLSLSARGSCFEYCSL